MFQSFRNKVLAIYKRVLKSIAFYPTLISLGLLSLAFILISFEDEKLVKNLFDRVPYLIIRNADTARTLASTAVAGLISMMVFSFSMVMVILNQASSNFSPRLLPGLVSDKKTQFVLGIYLGTILYNVIILMTIQSHDDKVILNSLSLLIGMILMIICLVLFIYFIHNVSSSIQINTILEKTYLQTRNQLEKKVESDKEKSVSAIAFDELDKKLYSEHSGYIIEVNVDSLKNICLDHACIIHIVKPKGHYIQKGELLLKLNTILSENHQKIVINSVLISKDIDAYSNYAQGIHHITEVGVKAMSPGINDPGTAIITINYLTELLALRMSINDTEITECGKPVSMLLQNIEPFQELLYKTMALYRTYCKHDIVLVEKLQHMLHYLKKQKAAQPHYYQYIDTQLKILKESYAQSLTNTYDLKKLNA